MVRKKAITLSIGHFNVTRTFTFKWLLIPLSLLAGLVEQRVRRTTSACAKCTGHEFEHLYAAFRCKTHSLPLNGTRETIADNGSTVQCLNNCTTRTVLTLKRSNEWRKEQNRTRQQRTEKMNKSNGLLCSSTNQAQK